MGGTEPSTHALGYPLPAPGPGATDWEQGWWAGFVSLVSFVGIYQPSCPFWGPEPADPSTPPGLFPIPT